MAKKLKDEDLVLNIIVNGDKGRSEMNQLNRAISDTKLQLTRLEVERKKLIASGKQNTIEWHANEKAIQQANNAIIQAEERLKVLRNGMKLTDMSIRDLIREQQRLMALMKTSVPGTENWIRYKSELKLVQNRLAELSGEAQRAGISLGKTADKFNRYFGIFTAFAGTVTVGVMGLRKASQAYAEYDDKLADVEKTTGLAKDQVKELSESLSNVDTRTAQLELLDLGRQAGKLGITAKENVESFVVAADKIGVALGEDLGGKEEAINKMGKLVDLFKIKDEYGMADGMLKVGSAVNALGAASTANEGYIVEFTSRVGGIALSSNISATNVMGLAATFDSLNAQSEASSTVTNKIIVGMFKNTSEYAKVAGMDVQAFKNLLASDTNDALLRVLEGFKGADLGVTANLLGEVGENGARVAQAVTLISENINTVREQQALANEEFTKGTGIVDEFNKKNITEQAILEKAQKRAQKRLVELGEIIKPLMSGAISGFSMVIKGLTTSIKFFIEYKAVIIGITVATLTLVATQKVKNNWDKITVTWSKLKAFWSNANVVAILRETVTLNGNTVATSAYTTSQKGLIAVKALLVGQFKAAGIAAKAFFVSLGPVGWLITGLTLLGGALGYVSARANKASSSQKALADINNKATLSIITEKSEIERLLAVASDKEESDNRRILAMEKLQKLIPNGVDLINQETIANGKAKIAVDKYIQSLLLRAKLEAAKDHLVEYEKERLEAMQDGSAANTSIWQKIGASARGIFGGLQATVSKTMDQSIDNLKEFETETKNTSESIAKYINDLEKQINSSPSEVVIGEGETCSTCGNNPCTCYKGVAEEKNKWTLENDEDFNRSRIVLRKQLLDGQIATEQEYSDKLLALEISTLESRLSAGKLGNDEILKLEGDLADKRYTQRKNENDRLSKLAELIAGGDTVEKEKLRFEKQKQAYGLHIKERKDMTADELKGLEILELDHNRNLSKIYMDGLEKKFKLQQNDGKRSLTEIKLSNADELAGLDTFAKKKVWLKDKYSADEYRQIITSKDADKAIKAVFDQREADSQKTHLSGMLETYVAYLSEYEKSGTILGKMVTEEDVEKLRSIIANLKEELAKAGANIKFTPDKGNGDGVDILGMTSDKWGTLFQNLKDGKIGMEEIAAIANAIGQAFSDVSNLMSAIEQKEFKSYEKTQNKKKKALDKQLNAGVISQESYNNKIQKIDDQTESKRIEMEQNQAKRQKALAIFQAIVNTAVAVVSALDAGAIIGPILAGVVGALGAVQIATIASTPLPGAEEGGMLVERSQDGKRFNAEFEPAKRGRVDKPTVIVGENGSEYVVPAEGYENPTIRPVLDIIEMARKNGTLRSINLPQIQTATMFGRQSGGYVSPSGTAPTATPQPSNGDNYARFIVVLERTEAVLSKVDDKLSRPFPSYVTINGPSGLAEQLGKYNKQKDNGRI